MPDPVSTIRNIGPASDAAYARAGITTAEQMRAMGTDTAYAKLLQSGARPHFIGYYVLVMGLQGRPWNDCKGAGKASLRERFDAIKAENTAQPLSELEKALDELGVIPRKQR